MVFERAKKTRIGLCIFVSLAIAIVAIVLFTRDKEVTKQKIFGIRHFESMSNAAPTSTQWTDKTLIDAELTPNGLRQCAKKRD